MEAWRAAVVRWGGTLFKVALLLTDQRAAAEALTIAALCRVFASAPSAQPELALYSALLAQRPPRRSPFRRGVLPRSLSRIAPHDRALLGLWLLRNLDGAQLATIFNQSPQTIVERLAAILGSTMQPPAPELDGDHLTLRSWLAAQLGIEPQQPMQHCDRCRSAQVGWQHSLAMLRATLYETLDHERLPQHCAETIEDTLQQAATVQPWWQERRIGIAALLAAVGAILALLVVPWSGSPASSTAAPQTARALVRETLDEWAALPASDVLHRQVWALDPRVPNSAPLSTDLWLSGSDTGRHRVEVRHHSQLVEWQVADGKGRLDYAGNPGYSACPWRTEASATLGMLDQAALTFGATPEQQRAALVARMTQGAYGAGYNLLRQALSAPDLRSFGTRREQQRTIVVLSYTDEQTQPPRQILLRINPGARQLHGVQEVALGDGQTAARDLWRLQALDEAAAPAGLPRWSQSTKRAELFDPSCPALNPQHVASLIASDGARFKAYFSTQGRIYSGDSAILPFQLQQPGVEMIQLLLRTGAPISVKHQAGTLSLQQFLPYRSGSQVDLVNGRSPQTPWLDRLADGKLVQRLQLDPATYQPQQLTILHRDVHGNERMLLTTTLIERRVIDPPPTAAVLELPPLPEDVLTMNVTASQETTVVLPPTPAITRTLSFAAADITVEQAPPQRGSRTGLSSAGLWQQRWDSFAGSDVWHQLVYRFPPDTGQIMITQGPQPLLRHMLRYQSSMQSWTTSRGSPVTIAGQPTTAWLLANDDAAALVFEIDHLLVHIAGPRNLLEETVLARLSELAWTPIQP